MEAVSFTEIGAEQTQAAAPARDFRVTVADETGFDFRGAEYRDLYQRAKASLFQHPLWLGAVFEQLIPRRDGTACVRTVRRLSDGRLCLAWPMIKRRIGPVPFMDGVDCDVSDYNPIIVDASLDVSTLQDAIRRDRSRLPPLGLARIRRIRADQASALAPLEGIRFSPMGYHAHEAPLSPDFSSWRKEALSASFVKTLDQLRRRLAKRGELSFREERDPAAIRAAFAQMREFRKGRFEGDPLLNPLYFDFYQRVAVAGAPEGFARTFVLSLDSRPISVIFGLSDAERFMFLMIAFDPAPELKNFSVGLLTIESLIEDCIARRQSVFDLTIGDEPYKQRFGTRHQPMLAAWVGNPALTAAADAAFRGVIAWRKRKAG
ncbi:GNAT family N-acetyltransferase [Alsobacter sp. KACC 23698]|uniref:GNAT family N-acetyltransferase n=1 Tax=Alsobacter sp. KACC 23698 TaxID=3149229 RepID=A0AAU7JJW0_9HYPH